MKDEIERLDILIGKILRFGVAISLVLMAVGAVLLVFKNRNAVMPYFNYLNLRSLLQGMLRLQPNAWFMGGMLTLILTPVLRVISSIFVFAQVKDWRYVLITSIVLVILLIAILFGVRAS